MAARRRIVLPSRADERAFERACRLLCAGPGRVAEAFGVTMEVHGEPVGRRVRVLDGPAPDGGVAATPRIGISVARELPWRYCAVDSRYLSRRFRGEPV
jgi:DNA-3-methyladenine glycosylase